AAPTTTNQCGAGDAADSPLGEPRPSRAAAPELPAVVAYLPERGIGGLRRGFLFGVQNGGCLRGGQPPGADGNLAARARAATSRGRRHPTVPAAESGRPGAAPRPDERP